MPKEIVYQSETHPEDEPLAVVVWNRDTENFQIGVKRSAEMLDSHKAEDGFYATIKTPEQADKLIKALRRAKRARFGTKAK